MSDRSLLMIPGPIELEPDVLRALGDKTTSHLDPAFMKAFGRVLARLREVFLAPSAQPFVIAGSGTFAMEMAVVNVIEQGDQALVVGTGYFSDRMSEMLRRAGATVTVLRVPLGEVPSAEAVSDELGRATYKVVTVTHVDTSTGVRAPVEGIARVAREAGALTIVDGVCSIGGEVLRQEDWGVDIALTGSQKALGAPPGLAVLMVGPRALEAHAKRHSPVHSLYADFGQWMPVMQAYEAGKPAYFATPAVNLVNALDVSVLQLIAEGMEARFVRHQRVAMAMRAAWTAMDLRPLPVSEDVTAHTLSALYYPEGVGRAVATIREQGVVVAGGLHPEAKTKYFRVGHMGSTGGSDVVATVAAVERALRISGRAIEPGLAIAAAERVFSAPPA